MLDYKKISFNKRNMAIYINIPFCKTPCEFCHYKENLKFGYNFIENNYLEILCEQLEELCKQIRGTTLKSIYFGGGTPSLLNDEQIKKIENLFIKYNITSEEISIEIHPKYCNFNYKENQFFTRYSIGIQTLEQNKLQDYNRVLYNENDIFNLINNINNKNINIDLLFEEKININDLRKIMKFEPTTITIYPNTKGKGNIRLEKVYTSFRIIKKLLEKNGYRMLMKSEFIFIKNGYLQSNYSKIEYETLGNIIGIGHNSVSYIGNNSYLCTFKNNNYSFELRKERQRYLETFISSVAFGVKWSLVKLIDKDLFNSRLFKKVDEISVPNKYNRINIKDLVYLPRNNYYVFYTLLQKKYSLNIIRLFLSSVMFGDNDENTFAYFFNKRIDKVTLNNLKKYARENNISILPEYTKKQMKKQFILIEGIDGSGKDTFINILSTKLKERFSYNEQINLSIVGQPFTEYSKGIFAKKFIENREYSGEYKDIIKILKANRLDMEKKLTFKNQGMIICIRGLLTEIATLNSLFKEKNKIDLGQGKYIKKIDKLIIIDISPEIANKRIEQRGIPRTWRENITWLKYFRNFYLNYNDSIIEKKYIVYNNSLEILISKANEIANELYFEC